MATRTHTGRAIEVPDLVGEKAEQAIQRLRELGLMPITWSAEVDDVNRAGFVLGLDPPAGTPVRPKASITMSVAAHPDFQGHAADTRAGESERLVQPPLTWPLSGPTGLAAPVPAPPSQALTDGFATAATPDAPLAPASSSIDAASRETRPDDAAASTAGQPTSGVAADPYPQDLSAPVPTPEEIFADAEWGRLRAAEAARHAAAHPSSDELQPSTGAGGPAVEAEEETAPGDSAAALEEQARREARRRRARRRARLTLKQQAIVAAVLAFTVPIGVAAMSGHKPVAPPTGRTRHRRPRPAHTASAPAAVRHQRAKAAPAVVHDKRAKAASGAVHRKRARARRRHLTTGHRATHTRVRTVSVQAAAPSTPAANTGSPAAPANSAPSNTAPANTGAGPTTTTPARTPVTPSHQPASSPSASGSRSSGSGGGSTLQSPDGTTAPPKP